MLTTAGPSSSLEVVDHARDQDRRDDHEHRGEDGQPHHEHLQAAALGGAEVAGTGVPGR